MHKTRLPLRMWFWAAYLMATGTPGMSARQLQRQLALTRYDTAWTMLHKLRAGMVDAERSKLSKAVEVDEFEIDGVGHGRQSGRLSGSKAVHCVVACEIRGKGSGRIRMEVILDASGVTLAGFGTGNVEPGAVVHTDGWQGTRRCASRATSGLHAASARRNARVTRSPSCPARIARSRT